MREWICSVMEPLNREWKFIAKQELVRCKNCKHGKRATNAKGEYMVDCLLADNWLKYPDWFCADGTKKGDSQNG